MKTIDLNSELAAKIVEVTRILLGITWNYTLEDVTEIIDNNNYYDIYVNNRLSASTSMSSIRYTFKTLQL